MWEWWRPLFSQLSLSELRNEKSTIIDLNTCLAAEPLSSLSKQLHDQRQGAQSMSKVIGLTWHATSIKTITANCDLVTSAAAAAVQSHQVERTPYLPARIRAGEEARHQNPFLWNTVSLFKRILISSEVWSVGFVCPAHTLMEEHWVKVLNQQQVARIFIASFSELLYKKASDDFYCTLLSISITKTTNEEYFSISVYFRIHLDVNRWMRRSLPLIYLSKRICICKETVCLAQQSP